MKICPNCGTRYTDETLRFCLQDGALLEFPSTQTPTVSLSGEESETVVRSAVGTEDRSFETRLVDPGTKSTSNGGKSNRLLGLAAVLSVLLLIAAVGLVGLWLLFGDSLKAWLRAGNIDRGNKNWNSPTTDRSPTPVGTPSPTGTLRPDPRPTATPLPTTAPTAATIPDSGIGERISTWRSRSEARDIEAYMDHYAPVIDYYNRSNATKAFVRADKMRAFSRYDTIRVTISDLSWTVSPDGASATAVFDKEWDFSGNGHSTGKVRQKVDFRNIDGRWLITGEHDVKVYYTN